MHSNTRQAANNHALEHSTGSERVDAFGLREMVLGKSRQAHQRTAGSPANAKLTFRYPSSLINHSTLLLERSSAKLLVFYSSLHLTLDSAIARPREGRGRAARGPREGRERAAGGPREGRGRAARGPREGRGRAAEGPRDVQISSARSCG